MIATPHALVGAAAGTGNAPLAAFAAGFASHFALDKIPYGGGYSVKGRSGKLRALADASCGIGLAAATGGDRVSKIAGAVGGIAPDVLVVAGRSRGGALGWFAAMHDRSHNQRGCGRRASFLLQALTAAAAVAALRSDR